MERKGVSFQPFLLLSRRSIFAKTPPAACPSHPRARSQVHPSPTASEGEEDYCAQRVDRPWNRSPGLGTVLPVLTVSITLVSSSLQAVWLASGPGNSWWAHFLRTLRWILHMPCKLASSASVDGHHCSWGAGSGLSGGWNLHLTNPRQSRREELRVVFWDILGRTRLISVCKIW